MYTEIEFIRQYEKYSVLMKGNCGKGEPGLEIFLDFPVVMQDISGAKTKLRYDRYESTKQGYQAGIEARDLYGNCYTITDVWTAEKGSYKLERKVSCKEVKEQTGIRLTSEFRCRDFWRNLSGAVFVRQRIAVLLLFPRVRKTEVPCIMQSVSRKNILNVTIPIIGDISNS